MGISEMDDNEVLVPRCSSAIQMVPAGLAVPFWEKNEMVPAAARAKKTTCVSEMDIALVSSSSYNLGQLL